MAHALCLLHNKTTNEKSEYLKQFLTAKTARRTNLNNTFVSTLPILDRHLNQNPLTSRSR
jgi:hypothetical protein